MTTTYSGTNTWRIVRWSAAAALLAMPLVAMRFTREVMWTSFDFLAAAVMLGGALGAYELLSRHGNATYRAALALAVFGAFALVWINAAVGVIGSEDNSANLMFAGVLAIGFGIAALGRFRAGAMARALFAAAIAQAVVGGIALAGGMGADGPIWPRDVIGVTAGFVALWSASGWLFGRAARG